MLRMSGGEGAELMRRWMAALLIAPAEERRGIVEAVEARIVSIHGSPTGSGTVDDETLLHIESEPEQKETHTEVVVRSFSGAPKASRRAAGGAESKRAG